MSCYRSSSNYKNEYRSVGQLGAVALPAIMLPSWPLSDSNHHNHANPANAVYHPTATVQFDFSYYLAKKTVEDDNNDDTTHHHMVRLSSIIKSSIAEKYRHHIFSSISGLRFCLSVTFLSWAIDGGKSFKMIRETFYR